MYYKLSAIELELLARDRRTILRQFQVNQVWNLLIATLLVTHYENKFTKTFRPTDILHTYIH